MRSGVTGGAVWLIASSLHSYRCRDAALLQQPPERHIFDHSMMYAHYQALVEQRRTKYRVQPFVQRLLNIIVAINSGDAYSAVT
jgi:hypothetical protein